MKDYHLPVYILQSLLLKHKVILKSENKDIDKEWITITQYEIKKEYNYAEIQ